MSYKNEQYAAQQVTDLTLLTKSLKTTQISLRKSEKERAIILTKAKKDIYELAGLQVKISEAKSKQKKERLQKRSQELANNLDDFENAYFTKVKEEKKIEQKGVNTAAQLKHKLEWELGAPILIDVDGNVISK
ncbi:MAG: hypothetical protein JKX72_03010 [Robiginitomaculum sp.]|nr:hypothetical protein [Robiginitomaculum sp.]